MKLKAPNKIKPNRYSHAMTVNISTEQHDAITAYCKEMNTNVSRTMRLLLEEYLKIVSEWDTQK